MLPTINCDITKAATNVAVGLSFIYKKWRKYLVAVGFFQNILLQDTSCKICILLQNIVTPKGKYLMTRYFY